MRTFATGANLRLFSLFRRACNSLLRRFATVAKIGPHYRFKDASRRGGNYTVLYCNTKPTHYKLLTRVSLFMACGSFFLAITIFNFPTESLNRQQKATTSAILSFQLSDRLIIGLSIVFGVILLGISQFYARRYILEIGMLDGQTVRFVSGAKFGLGYREQFVETHQLTTTSHSRLLSQVATDEKGLADYFIIKKEGSMFHHLMDITADGVYMDRDALQSLFFPSYSAQRKKTFPFKE